MPLNAPQLVFTLIFDEGGALDPAYCDQFPHERKMQARGVGAGS